MTALDPTQTDDGFRALRALQWPRRPIGERTRGAAVWDSALREDGGVACAYFAAEDLRTRLGDLFRGLGGGLDPSRFAPMPASLADLGRRLLKCYGAAAPRLELGIAQLVRIRWHDSPVPQIYSGTLL